jgi:hypothetical protein
VNVAYTCLELFHRNYACYANKTWVAIIVNHLELVSTNFGATLVFKVLSNLLLKILLENGQKPFIFSFYSLIQNLLGILSWSLNKSCRGLNYKQLSFLGHF